MRAAMTQAVVGDDVFGEDPTVNELQRRAAKLLGKEAALLVPSGTMANLVSFLSQTQPGDSVILSEISHPFKYESGNLAMVGGLLTKTVSAPCGVLTPELIEPQITQIPDHHFSPTTLVAIENTTNGGGGAVYALETVTAIGALAHERGLKVHCDGARLFNAVVASGVSAADFARSVDTISFCLSKGLGAPVGSLVVGDTETIDKAHRYRKMLGGGMRQAGVLAAAGIYALDHHIDRLADDHRRAAHFRSALEGTAGLTFPLPSPTNIVFVDLLDAYAAVGQLAEQGVFCLPVSATRLRVVFHLDVDDAGVEKAINAFRAI